MWLARHNGCARMRGRGRVRGRSAAVALALLVAVMSAVTSAATDDDDDDDFSLDPTSNGSKVSLSCNTEKIRDGICIKYSQCRDNFTIDIWGSIDDNEIRTANCPGDQYWCCQFEGPYGQLTSSSPPIGPPTEPTPQPTELTPKQSVPTPEPTPQPTAQPTPQPTLQPTPPPQTYCSTAADGECPWCVTLHRNGGAPWTRGPDGRYCAGALVGGGDAVLTAASCVRAATRQTLWLQHAADNYTVHSVAIHPRYNSGSREHDLALVVLSRRVAGAGGAGLRGACLSLDAPPLGECRTLAPADKDAPWIQSTVSVSAGVCSAGGAEGAACARAEEPDACRVLLGAPLLCGRSGGWQVAGVSRGGGCKTGATYSAVSEDAQWLRSLLPDATRG